MLSRWNRALAIGVFTLASLQFGASLLAMPALAQSDCSEFAKDTPEASLQAVQNAMDDTRQDMSMVEAAIENGVFTWGYLAVPEEVALQNWLSRVLADYAANESPEAIETLEKRLLQGMEAFVAYQRQQRQALAHMQEDLVYLGQCYTEIQVAADRDRRELLSQLSLDAEVAADEEFQPFSTRRIIVEKRRDGVTYHWEAEGCDLTYTWTLTGIPESFAPDASFTVGLSGSVSGTCGAADGQCRDARVQLRSGLELVGGGNASVDVGVPRAGKPATRECQRPSYEQNFELRHTGGDEAVMELLVGHGSGALLVTRYTWNSLR